jgi:hypothetical protein
MTLIPAYGRDYKSIAQVKADFEANKDFEIASIGPDCGRYANRAALAKAGVKSVMIRYARLTKVVEVEVRS